MMTSENQNHTKILNDSNESIQKIIETLKSNEIVAIPTETVYGLAGNAFNSESVAKIFAAKERPFFDPLIVHLSYDWIKSDGLSGLVSRGILNPSVLNPHFTHFFNDFVMPRWPGPLTLILPKGPKIPDIVTAAQPTVGLRVPHHPLTQKLLSEIDFPLAAPSANRFGRISPTHADAVVAELNGKIKYVLDGGPCSIGLESTIIQPNLNTDGEVYYLRPGAIGIEEVEAFIGKEKTKRVYITAAPPTVFTQPGMLESHYAPATAIQIIDLENIQKSLPLKTNATWIVWSANSANSLKETTNVSDSNILQLCKTATGTTVEAAANFFQTLRKADERNTEQIYVLRDPFWPDSNQTSDALVQAIQDRLTRAVAGHKK